MELTLFTGTANPALGEAVAAELGVQTGSRQMHEFPDGELQAELQDSVRGHDVYLIQPTSPPGERNLLELLLLADAAQRAGASRLTALIPYFGYARQDRRASGRGSVGAKLIAELLKAGGLQRVVSVDVHTSPIEGFFGVPLEHLTAVPMLVDATRAYIAEDSVIVAPDLGAVKLAERYARILDLPVAMVHKTRLSGSEVSVRSITGEVQGRTPIIVDDMISTGGTTVAAVDALLEEECNSEITVVASHGLFVGPAVDHLRAAYIKRLIVTDSVALVNELPLPIERVSLAPLLARAVDHLHNNRSLSELLTYA